MSSCDVSGAVSTDIRSTVSWIQTSEALYLGYRHQRHCILDTDIRGTISWIQTSEALYLGYRHQRHYILDTDIRGTISWIQTSEALYLGYRHQRHYILDTVPLYPRYRGTISLIQRHYILDTDIRGTISRIQYLCISDTEVLYLGYSASDVGCCLVWQVWYIQSSAFIHLHNIPQLIMA